MCFASYDLLPSVVSVQDNLRQPIKSIDSESSMLLPRTRSRSQTIVISDACICDVSPTMRPFDSKREYISMIHADVGGTLAEVSEE
jgi:hypothetical protein